MAAEKSLERCGTDHFDLVMLHNPDETGYTSDAVWQAMAGLKKQGLTKQLGIAPGPANGFTLDIVHCFEEFCELIDWAMIILNPLEPWPGQLVLPAADQFGVNVLTRVVDYGGIFWDDVKPGHQFRPGDHRTYRPEGWIDQGTAKMEAMREIANKYNLTMIQFASLWNLAQSPVLSVIPTFVQEAGEGARSIEDKIRELAALPEVNPLTPEDVAAITAIGDNTGCMKLKGASFRHTASERPDEWAMRDDLIEVSNRWDLGRDW